MKKLHEAEQGSPEEPSCLVTWVIIVHWVSLVQIMAFDAMAPAKRSKHCLTGSVMHTHQGERMRTLKHPKNPLSIWGECGKQTIACSMLKFGEGALKCHASQWIHGVIGCHHPFCCLWMKLFQWLMLSHIEVSNVATAMAEHREHGPMASHSETLLKS